jgi:hypothetical protein
MGLLIAGFVLGLLLCAALRGGRRSGLEGDIITEPKPPTRVVRPGEPRGYTPNVPPVDWAKVDRRGMRSGLIPGRPGQQVNSGGDAIIPPLRPDPPRPVDLAAWELLPGYPPDRSR